MAATVSVALCTHNGARFIEQQLRSILEQEPAPADLVLSDDASTDDTVAIAQRVAAEYPETRLRVLRNDPALGVTANFELAISATSGDLIALSDQDDVWHPGRLATVVTLFAANPDLTVVASDARLVDAEGQALGGSLLAAIEVGQAERDALNGDAAFATLLRRNLLTGATMVLRRSVLDRALPFPPSWVHDEWIAAIASTGGGIRLLDDQLIDYRQHGANQIGAERLSLLAKLRRLAEPRRDRNARLLRRAAALVDRLDTLGLAAELREAARGKLAHELRRSDLPAGRLRRVLPVLSGLRAGSYAAYGRGALDAVRDLVQPDR